MIRKEKDYFILDTDHTTYCFRVLPTGQLEHLYYGRKLHIEDEADMQPLVEKHVFAPGNVNLYNEEQKAYSLEDMRLEMSSYGKGDIREPFVEVVNANGSNTIDFVYREAEITKGKEAFAELPGSYGSEEEVEQLCIRLADEGNELALELYYYVYPSCDIISRSAKFYNNGKKAVQLKRLMSLQLDFDGHDYAFTTFHGAWAREMKRSDMPVIAGKLVNASYTGTTSSRYRHDLRHHLQYLYACLENHQIQKAEDYISDICNELEQQKVIQYCENEAANLILSSFAGRAEAEGIVMKVEGGMKAKTVISDTDLCVLLSNALENAIHACREVQKEGKEARIEVQIYEKQQQVFLQIKNSCAGAPIFENGVPVSKEKGHGIGTRSICAIVERYGGVYTFSLEKEHFILRLNLSEKNVDSVHFTAV